MITFSALILNLTHPEKPLPSTAAHPPSFLSSLRSLSGGGKVGSRAISCFPQRHAPAVSLSPLQTLKTTQKEGRKGLSFRRVPRESCKIQRASRAQFCVTRIDADTRLPASPTSSFFQRGLFLPHSDARASGARSVTRFSSDETGGPQSVLCALPKSRRRGRLVAAVSLRRRRRVRKKRRSRTTTTSTSSMACDAPTEQRRSCFGRGTGAARKEKLPR